MLTSRLHRSVERSRPTRRRVLAGLVGLLTVGGAPSVASAIAPSIMRAGSDAVADVATAGLASRSVALRSVNTGERVDVTYRRQGQLDVAALGRLDALMRDWRNDAITSIDPALFDMIWALGKSIGQDPEFTVVCGYRSRETNEALIRAGRRGIARNSMHTQGKAADISISGTGLRALRDAALALNAGGVGYYPSSNFVHVDTGEVRSW